MKEPYKLIAVIAGVLLLFGVLNLPYGYYNFLRLVIFVCGLVAVYHFYEQSGGWMVVFGVVALVFNPIAPVYLNKGMWVLIDLLAAICFFSSTRFSSTPKGRTL